MIKRVFSVASLLSLGFALSSCDSGEAVKEAENEVFAIHDEVMPKIDDIMKLRKRLNQYVAVIDSLKASGSATTALRSDEEKAQASRLVQNLTVADSLMMNWMDRYNGDTLAKLSSDEALRYLADQKEQITDVKAKVTTSIEQATEFLQKK